MVHALADADGLNASDFVRQLIRRHYAEKSATARTPSQEAGAVLVGMQRTSRTNTPPTRMMK